MGNALPRPSRDADVTRVHGLYATCPWDPARVRRLILERKLAPCHKGVAEAPDDGVLEECPICMLSYPLLNRTGCCDKGICTGAQSGCPRAVASATALLTRIQFLVRPFSRCPAPFPATGRVLRSGAARGRLGEQ